jgi:transcription antitermination factor NusG
VESLPLQANEDNECPGHSPWYALRVRSSFESVVSRTLREKGYEEYLPVYHSRRHWSDRVKVLDLPLFPGYVFCRLDLSQRILPVLTTPGVVRVVGAGRDPIPVSEEEIAAVKVILNSGLGAHPWPFLAVGSTVYIERGPLAGLEGIVLNLEKQWRLVVSVSLLQRSVAVEIDREWARVTKRALPERAPSLAGGSPRSGLTPIGSRTAARSGQL